MPAGTIAAKSLGIDLAPCEAHATTTRLLRFASLRHAERPNTPTQESCPSQSACTTRPMGTRRSIPYDVVLRLGATLGAVTLTDYKSCFPLVKESPAHRAPNIQPFRSL